MDKKLKKQLIDIFVRYLILILIALPNLYIFYLVFKPLTLYPIYHLLCFFFDCQLVGSTISVGCFPIEIIDACVAGSAYYLLLILNLSTPNIKLLKRLKMILLAVTSFLALNLIRIFFLSILYIHNSPWFDILHKTFWYLLSIVFVIGIWFAEVKIFKIKEIPFYTDFLFLKKMFN